MEVSKHVSDGARSLRLSTSRPSTNSRHANRLESHPLLEAAVRNTHPSSQAVETWLREEVATAYDALVNSPHGMATADDVRAILAARQGTRG
ncbi:hypothetical protein [Arthrobacter sp.]|uniref:hypothetical protein n=1 Tax=Arthrobacter sp. TaxID=1667 RepID=UPI003A92307C